MDLEVVDLDLAPDDLVDRVDRACRSVGFFLLRSSAIPVAVADEAWKQASSFFELADDEKAAVGFPEAGYPYGYSPFQFETLSASIDEGGSPADLKESFSVGPDCLGSPPEDMSDPDEIWIRSQSLWPSQLPALRPAWEAYFRAMADVSAQLLSVMALALELPADHFEPLIDRHTSAMRALNYPAITASTLAPDSLRAGAHTDYGTLTILRTDDVPGLQVSLDGQWHDVGRTPGTYVVNLGDSIAQWTNDRWRSTMHRVLPNDPSPRQSMAFFHMANWDAWIECLPTCLETGEKPRHEPVQAGPWLMSKFQSTVGLD